MHRFWEKVIKPIIITVRPKVIVEVGSFSGFNTFKLLDYCRYTGSRCVVIEPQPKYDVPFLKEYYGNAVRLIEKLSLDAMPLLGVYDMILLDSDPNWYTVYHELRLVEQMCLKEGAKFPVTIIHDTGWPYGRRDMYHAPESIPDKFLHPYDKKGVMPDFTGLLEQGGFNDHMHHALHEFGPRNGVLTAIEDFLRETELPLKYHELQSNNGLGIIVDEAEMPEGLLPYILDSSGL
ncbi:class I SAM-dependent methyltransferase [Paenibacillus sp. DYY-L-2]|uniref:class I SAM-dependent methyltransferase n=1 Tax=Paenibacillus sp. DYY-L-2 TaxID=3447013 RepID=UPI003F502AF4